MKFRSIVFLTACFSLSVNSFTFAAGGIEVKPIHFAKGSSSTTVSDKIQGDQTMDYQLTAKAGQKMAVTLQTNNNANYFNVLPPGSETALFVGSTSGNEWSDTLPVDGDYRVRVYLMRSAARRNEHAQYTLKLGISGPPSATVPQTDAKVPGTNYHATGEMPCVMATGQKASCSFGVTREGNGSGVVTITKPDASSRSVIFKNGKAVAYDQSQADSEKFSSQKEGDLNIVHIGQERYEIPDVVIFGD